MTASEVIKYSLLYKGAKASNIFLPEDLKKADAMVQKSFLIKSFSLFSCTITVYFTPLPIHPYLIVPVKSIIWFIMFRAMTCKTHHTTFDEFKQLSTIYELEKKCDYLTLTSEEKQKLLSILSTEKHINQQNAKKNGKQEQSIKDSDKK